MSMARKLHIVLKGDEMINLCTLKFYIRNCAECGEQMTGEENMFEISFEHGKIETKICRSCLHTLVDEAEATVRLDGMKHGKIYDRT